MGWFSRGKNVLTVGSVHLDTIALSQTAHLGEGQTEVGSITHSVGGSAYNIAANLASHHGKAIRQTAIYSILPQHSVLTERSSNTRSTRPVSAPSTSGSTRTSSAATCAEAAMWASSTIRG